MHFKDYDSKSTYDELIGPGGRARPHARQLIKYLRSLSQAELQERKEASDLAITVMGITYTVYTEEGQTDTIWPFDIIPRIIPRREWDGIAEGLKQRVQALNMFIADVYDRQMILKDKIIPKDLILQSRNFRKQAVGMKPHLNIWAHICGSDLVRDERGEVFVLEDNMRVPSGVSYMLENRQVTKRIFPELFEDYSILPIDDYPSQLFDTLASVAPEPKEYPEVVVLTPGIYNSAYFEHAYLAQQMGAELVEGRDLIVAEDDCVYMKTVSGLSRVDVIYRRIDDLFLDPEAFNPDSLLGVPGLLRSWSRGKVTLANAPGCGVADDKVVCYYVPDMIRYYLSEEPILPNVETYLCENKSERDYVLKNLDKLVVKPANEAGGYGMLIGPKSTAKERKEMAARIRKTPREYIAQPTLSLSTAPTLINNSLEPRHLDLRPFILSGENTAVTTGGLTRVALRKGSLVVNSSQGGGSKDTWIVDMEGQ
ncbi:putative circularly permuted ATP-grasp superfamily protein [Methylohalomonas lacus]|uniref:Circularly permuted ATP-grasp superfamily protein n=1 Tax=Methylohalomonas lacus TaxID=398773 RepID=A0AAE3HL63_9GAMM|nr:circularly permuted type 2 ATP-grasp protein [Methylohalomonas lacus]MCS3903149.1 putative circularly permuted ATP-grasp superfamily protein [Methylohalomonas lacus]